MITKSSNSSAGWLNHVLIQKIDAENAARNGTYVVGSGGAPRAVTGQNVIPLSGNGQAEADGKFRMNRESLGTRDFNGIQAEGSRITITFAANTIGNEREIQVVTETWISKDLGVVVYSKKSDPRSGETTYQMTNITRAEPDASLFPGR